MADSEITIVNLALAAAGATKFLSGDLADAPGPEAAMARLYYPQRRDELLECFPWYFARRRAQLAELANVTRTDWPHVYAAPADMKTARAIVRPGIRFPRSEDEVAFAIEAGDADSEGEPGAPILLCDLPQAELLYTGRVTAPPRFSALFTSALVDRLAVDLATYLTRKADLAAEAQRRFIPELAQAKAHSANQGKRDQPSAPDFIEGTFESEEVMGRVRFGGT